MERRRVPPVPHGNAWLRAAVRTKGSYYRTVYHPHNARGGPKKANR